MLNQCNFIGRLSANPETRYTQNGDAVSSFTLGCSEKWKDREGKQHEKTEWVRCVAWRKLGEIVSEYCKKGSLVFISGSMQTRQWEDKDGNKRYTTEIVAQTMKMLSPRNSDGRDNTPEPTTSMETDVPF